MKIGAMDEWGIERASLAASLEKAIRLAGSNQQNRDSGQMDLLSVLMDDSELYQDLHEYIHSEAWPTLQRLKNEKDTLGFFLTGHPVEHYIVEFKDHVTSIASLNPYHIKKTSICALLKAQKRMI